MSELYTGNLRKANIDISSAATNEIIPAPSAGYIVIDFIALMPNSAVTLTLKDGATTYGAALALAEKQPIVFENTIHSDQGIITLTAGNAFNILLGSAVQVSGFVRYRVIGQ